MKPIKQILTVTFHFMVILSLFGTLAQASEREALISLQQKMWADANYQLKDDAQEQAFKRLVLETEKACKSYPDDAVVWAWSGIIKSSYGAAIGGLSALSWVKAAKKDFEKALSLDSRVLDGSTHASLALLYHKVPGWPIGFGDDDKAEKLFKQALKIDPKGRESNYFYGEYLFDEGRFAQAKQHLTIAQNVPFWSDRPVAYEHRQKQIVAMLEKVETKLNKQNYRR